MQAVSYISQNSPYAWVMAKGRPASTKRPQLGERIAQARLQAGLTQAQLAEKLDTSQRVVTYWEREAVGLRADQLAKLAEALGVSADYFLGREAKKRGSGPAGKARLLFEQVSQLPRFHQQRILATVEDMLIARTAKNAE
ncbi:MAG: helix-turn-helix domain-containing protein [Chthoniobacterales bacterium]